MFERLLAELVNDQGAMAIGPGDGLLDSVRKIYGLKHVAYMGVNLPANTHREYFVHNTYSHDWSRHYETRNYVSLDPVVRLGLNNLMPIDWSEVRDLSVEQLQFLGEAREFGIGNNGLSFPVRGAQGELAVFSMSVDCTKSDWRLRKSSQMREYRIIAEYFHQRVLSHLGVSIDLSHALSDREKECLRWCGAGKTYWEISRILSVSESTVRFHMQNAIHKLDCLNQVQAVLKATKAGLI